MRRSNAGLLNRRRNRPPTKMDPIKLQFRSTRSGYKSPRKLNAKSGIVIYTSIALFIACVCYIFMFHTRTVINYAEKRYGIVLDGGSTGTRIHVFEYEVKDGKLVFDFGKNELASMKVNPGLSAYADEPDKAESAMAELVEFGKSRVPKEHWGETEIRLMATAGLRLLKIDVQRRILDACRRVFRRSGFRFQDDWASVISGSDEGVYAWVVANFARGTLGHDPQKTTGIIELGGASAQVTFVSNEPLPPEFARIVKYGNYNYNLYSHSLLQFGQNVAFDLLRESFVARDPQLVTYSMDSGKPLDPCTPRGYAPDIGAMKLSDTNLGDKNNYISSLHPSGNFTACRSASLTFLQKGKERCSYKNCDIGSTFIPKLQGQFLATENFFHTSKFFELSQTTVHLSDLMVAGQRFCGDDWSNLRRKYSTLDEDELLRYCFSSSYIIALLHDSLGIGLNDQRIGFANQVNSIPLDWALGAFILQTKASFDQESSHITASVINDFHTFLLLFGVAVFLISGTWYFTRCRKPQLKTIYDLEKGKYIVTHVRRQS